MLGSSTATVTAAAGGGLGSWSLGLENPSGATPSPGDAPLHVDAQWDALVTAVAALPDFLSAEQSTVTSVRVRTAESVPATVTWLRDNLGDDDPAWVSVGAVNARATSSPSMSVTVTSVSDATVATATQVFTAHPDLREFSVSDTGVYAIAQDKTEARRVVAAFTRTPSDRAEQQVMVWWPDGNGTRVSGTVGSAAG